MARNCGSCGVCCKVPKIDVAELQKPAGLWCPNCQPGRGCSIYETRPTVCRDYRCVWLATDFLSEDARPDKLKVMFSVEPNPLTNRPGKVCAVARTSGSVELYERPAVLAAIAALVRAGLDVHLSWGETKTLVIPHFGLGGVLKALDIPRNGGRTRQRKMLGRN